MADSKLRKLLSGGDLRSIGRANEAARGALHDRTLVAGLVCLMFDDDPIVSARAADALEKASAADPTLIGPHRAVLLGAIRRALSPEVAWHLCQVLPRLDLSARQRSVVGAWLAARFRGDHSRIVRVNALQGLCDLAARHGDTAALARAALREAFASGVPALVARARKLQTTADTGRQEAALEPARRNAKQRDGRSSKSRPRQS